MSNDKDLQRKMKEQMIALLDSYEKMAKNLAEENEHKEVKEFKPEKCRIVDMLERINNNENVLDTIGFITFKDRKGFLFGKLSDYTFETVSLMIIEMYEQCCDDETDDVGFEDFLNNLADTARITWTRITRTLKRESKNNERY